MSGVAMSAIGNVSVWTEATKSLHSRMYRCGINTAGGVLLRVATLQKLTADHFPNPKAYRHDQPDQKNPRGNTYGYGFGFVQIASLGVWLGLGALMAIYLPPLVGTGPTSLACANKLLADDNEHFPTVSYISPSSEMRINSGGGRATKIDERSCERHRGPEAAEEEGAGQDRCRCCCRCRC